MKFELPEFDAVTTSGESACRRTLTTRAPEPFTTTLFGAFAADGAGVEPPPASMVDAPASALVSTAGAPFEPPLDPVYLRSPPQPAASAASAPIMTSAATRKRSDRMS